jgi:hypothetical protein
MLVLLFAPAHGEASPEQKDDEPTFGDPVVEPDAPVVDLWPG